MQRRPPARAPGATLPKDLVRELKSTARTNHADDALKAMERFFAARAKDNLGEAQRQLVRAKEAAPRSVTVREALGKIWLEREQWHEAAQELLAHRRLTGEQRNAPVIAVCYLRLGRPARALLLLAELDKKTTDTKTWAEARSVRAQALAATGRATEAIDFLTSEIRYERDQGARARLERARNELPPSE